MNLLFRNSEQNDYTWSLAVQGGELIHFRLNRREGKWNAPADELEVALSMWLFSFDELEKNEEINLQDIIGDEKDDEWLRVEGSPARPGLRVLGPYTESLHRDLSWWMPIESTRIMRYSTLTTSPNDGISNDELSKENHRVVGPGGSDIDRRQYGVEELPEFTIEKIRTTDHENGKDDKSIHDFLAAEFHGPLKSLYAQDIFSSFFRTAAMTLEKPLEGPVETRPKCEAAADTSWKSFTLRNDQISKLVRNIESTGLDVNVSEITLRSSFVPTSSMGRQNLNQCSQPF
ncbi:hypothetical protein CSAL01_01168 [Colletotrichum salicis]|uniref:Uncharacterized protein n=1 Tax=Colletotrichum salicis TaxID=1209931 RepID=A0A135U071_9PEZI|nr:hypothetical protein CSAL01_01168 [Colletotrichum salicis]